MCRDRGSSSRDYDNEGDTGGWQRIIAALCLIRGGENERRGQFRLGFSRSEAATINYSSPKPRLLTTD